MNMMNINYPTTVLSLKLRGLRSVPFQFEYVSTTVVPLSIMELTNSLCTESAARDIPDHVIPFISVSLYR